jgi:hypothetical protein
MGCKRGWIDNVDWQQGERETFNENVSENALADKSWR